ncbi:MAG: putative bisphosphate nucleotidase [Streblomastix strix]|uniref:3'(2'),5'-bisphosphate nucleotidase 1 n=1 Tax=Streblomastix strix TaxID=222440 RepID=A0A5J4WFC4_9EUKA|nr:MAG: putative bisphosphate nucleotidase [Streblomastix strix]
MTIKLSELLSCCIDCAEQGSRIIQQVHQSHKLKVRQKSSADDLVTIADTECEKRIIGLIHSVWPDLNIVGEENSNLRTTFTSDRPRLDLIKQDLPIFQLSEVTLFVDPLDATGDFVKGFLDPVMILIGIAVNERPYAGIASYVFKHDNEQENGPLIWGAVGLGIFGSDRKDSPIEELSIKKTIDNSVEKLSEQENKKCRVIHSWSVKKYGITDMLEFFAPYESIPSSGMGNKIIEVVNGNADVLLAPEMHPSCRWDICAPEALLLASGGVLTDINGGVYKYTRDRKQVINDRGLLAYYPSTAQHFVDRFFSRRSEVGIKDAKIDEKDIKDGKSGQIDGKEKKDV